MPTDLEQKLTRSAAVLDREAPTISIEEIVGRGTVAVDVDLLAHPRSGRAFRVDGVSWIGTTPGQGEIGEGNGVIELAPALDVRRPAWRRVALRVALGAAAAAVLVVSLAAIDRGGDELNSADLPNLTTTFVSPRHGFSVMHPDGVASTPAVQVWGWGEQLDDGFDVVEIGPDAVFKGASAESGFGAFGAGRSIDERVDHFLSGEGNLPGGCGVPRAQQAEITIDGQSGRIAECPNRVEATVVAGGRLYLFTLEHDRSDARAAFDAIVATVDLTPDTAVDFPGMTKTFVSPTYGYSFGYIRGLEPATERWDPDNQPGDEINFDPRFDAVETGWGAYLQGASTPIPDGVSVDAWVDEYVTPPGANGCGIPRSQQAQIAIDGQVGRIATCQNRGDVYVTEATVVAGGRLYLFRLYRDSSDARAMFDAWIATIDLAPETAAVS